MLLHRHRDAVHTAGSQGYDFGGTSGVHLPHEEARFGDHRLTTAEGRRAFGEYSTRPLVVGVVPGEQRHQGTGIEQHASIRHWPKPSRCFRFVERSRGPFLNRPTLGRRDRARFGAGVLPDARSCIPAVAFGLLGTRRLRPSIHPVPPGRLCSCGRGRRSSCHRRSATAISIVLQTADHRLATPRHGRLRPCIEAVVRVGQLVASEATLRELMQKLLSTKFDRGRSRPRREELLLRLAPSSRSRRSCSGSARVAIHGTISSWKRRERSSGRHHLRRQGPARPRSVSRDRHPQAISLPGTLTLSYRRSFVRGLPLHGPAPQHPRRLQRVWRANHDARVRGGFRTSARSCPRRNGSPEPARPPETGHGGKP